MDPNITLSRPIKRNNVTKYDDELLNIVQDPAQLIDINESHNIRNIFTLIPEKNVIVDKIITPRRTPRLINKSTPERIEPRSEKKTPLKLFNRILHKDTLKTQVIEDFLKITPELNEKMSSKTVGSWEKKENAVASKM